MANNYTSSSFSVSGTEKQIDWLEDLAELAYFLYLETEAGSVDDLALGLLRARFLGGAARRRAAWDDLLAAAKRLVGEGYREPPGVSVSRSGHAAPGAPHRAVVWGEDSFDPDYASRLMLEWMEKFDLPGPISFEWARTCSKPRPGEFGGGACFLTRAGAVWFTTTTWADQKRKEYQAVVDSLLVR